MQAEKAQTGALETAGIGAVGGRGSASYTLPSPLRHAAGVSSLSVIATSVGSAVRPGATVGGVTLQVLAALVGYVGGVASAVALSSRWASAATPAPSAPLAGLRGASVRSTESSRDASVRSTESSRDEHVRLAFARFASGAVVPVAVSGVFNWIPWLPMTFALALAGAAVSVHSGWVGASAMLTLEGQPRKRAAVVPAGVAVGLVLLATLARTVLPT